MRYLLWVEMGDTVQEKVMLMREDSEMQNHEPCPCENDECDLTAFVYVIVRVCRESGRKPFGGLSRPA